MIKKYFLYGLLLLQAGWMFAQSGSIEGTIVTSDGQSAEFVNVGLKGTSKGTTADKDGYFRITGVSSGSYTLVVSFVGLETKELAVEVGSDLVTVPQIVLSESSQQLEEVIVTGAKTYKEDVVSASLRITTPILETPQNIQVVTGKLLADQQVISMSDGVLRNVSGAVRLEHWGDLYTNVTMRGSQVQAFRNGFNIVTSYWGPLTEDMSFVDHIEFVKGPAGFMLANGDPSGLYNVVTKKPTGVEKGEVSLTMGSNDLYRATVDLDGRLSEDGKLLYRLNVAGQNKKSHRDYEYNNRYTFAPVISYQIDEKTIATLEYTMQYAKMSNVGSYYVFSPDGYGTLPNDFTTMPPGLDPTRIQDQSVYLNLRHDLTQDWKLTAQAAYFNYQQEGSSMWPVSVNADGTMIRGVNLWDAFSEMTLGQIYLNGKVTTGDIRHQILAGVDAGTKEYMADWSQSHALDSAGAEFDPQNPTYGTPVNGYPEFDRSLNLEARSVLSGGNMNQQYTGLYIQDELGFWNNQVRLTLAGRYTYASQAYWGGSPISDWHFTPRVGLSASLDKRTSLYALYDQAFTPQSGRLANGGEVKPITGNNIELGIKRDWADSKWNTTFALYRIIKNNELTSDPNSSPSENLSVVLGQKQAQGIEFDLRGTIAEGLSLVANYAYTDSKVTEVTEGVTGIAKGDVIPGFAKHTANTWLSYQVTSGILEGAGVSLGFTYMADRATSTWSESDDSMNLPDYFRLDGGVFWESGNLRVNYNVFNILDKSLYSGGYYVYLNAYYWQTEPLRNSRISLAYTF